jgi:16S rRNA (cytosine967-C5)-methyltransferase
VADVPCTGSGTWARTPENLVFFEKEAISQYAGRQLAIARECLRWLKPGGWLAYITCSVFAEENEGVVAQLLEQPGLHCLVSQPIAGWPHGADSMYVAVLQQR